jgi:hypothetical protein
MVGSDEDQGRNRRLGAEDREWSSTGRVLGGRMIERPGYAVCGLQCEQGGEEHGFLVSTSKPTSTVSLSLASKPLIQFSQFGPQTWQLRFGDLAHKITVAVS